jgi:hypothetical protein
VGVDLAEEFLVADCPLFARRHTSRDRTLNDQSKSKRNALTEFCPAWVGRRK